MAPYVTLVVLNWNNAGDTLQCLASLESLTYPNYGLLVVDNGSTDDSVQRIRAVYPTVTLLETGENLGYAGGNNVGIRYALEHEADLICILNNDVAVAPDFLEPLFSVLLSDPKMGVVTPLIADMANPDYAWTLGAALNRRNATVLRLFTGEKVRNVIIKAPFEVDVAPGSAMLVRREVFENVGLMNEDFFLYYEESDWSLLVKKAGYRIVAVPQSLVWHKVSAALGESSPVIDYYMQRNYLLFITRHWSGISKYRLLSRAVMGNCLSIVVYTLKPHQRQRFPNRNARVLALRDAFLGRWGKMGPDVSAICYPKRN